MSDQIKLDLTPAQKECLNFLKAFYHHHGYYPTIREIGVGVIDGEQVIGKRLSNNAIQGMLKRLEQRGWIKRLPLARAIQVL
tara:strand:+ start:659 stop:904 length:246 start_codon:yes stop_codon:yes gene_type:complete